MTLETVSTSKAHGGTLGVYKHASAATGTEMTFSVFAPPQAQVGEGAKLPVLFYLSGLTCTHANVTDKGEYRRLCAELGLVFVAPDTSPRGEGVADDPAGAYDFGLGAGFYVNATQAPFAAHYRMWDYIAQELPALVAAHFPVDPARMGITAPGAGATDLQTFKAFRPSRRCRAGAVPWGHKARVTIWARTALWRAHDAGAGRVRQAPGVRDPDRSGDSFLAEQLRPHLFGACEGLLDLSRADDYNHGIFISADHVRRHAQRL
jgi:S-formylglutathione hydrolase